MQYRGNNHNDSIAIITVNYFQYRPTLKCNGAPVYIADDENSTALITLTTGKRMGVSADCYGSACDGVRWVVNGECIISTSWSMWLSIASYCCVQWHWINLSLLQSSVTWRVGIRMGRAECKHLRAHSWFFSLCEKNTSPLRIVLWSAKTLAIT